MSSVFEPLLGSAADPGWSVAGKVVGFCVESHTVLDLVVQAIFTPWGHVSALEHPVHGEFPDRLNVEPAAH